jgi:hypothetical protein
MVAMVSTTLESKSIPKKIEPLLLPLWRDIPIPNLLRRIFLYIINYKFIVGVIGLIRNEKGEILLFKNTYYKDHPWTLPGGIVKQNSLTGALIDEIQDESGFIVEVKNVHGLVIDERRISILFDCEIVENNFKPSAEVLDFRFISPDDLNDVGVSSKEIIKYINNDDLDTKNDGIYNKKIRIIDFTGREFYNNKKMLERRLVNNGDIEPKKKIVKQNQKENEYYNKKGVFIFDIVPDEDIPLPPFAYETEPTEVNTNTTVTKQAKEEQQKS